MKLTNKLQILLKKIVLRMLSLKLSYGDSANTNMIYKRLLVVGS